MASGLECAQAVQLFEQNRRLHFGIEEHKHRRRARLAKYLYRLFSVDARAEIHQNDIRPFFFKLLKIS